MSRKKFIILFLFLIFASFYYLQANEISTTTAQSLENLKTEYTNRVFNFMNRYYANKNYLVEINFLDGVNISSQTIEIDLSLDETQFLDKDFEFIKSVIISQIGLDTTAGNKVNLYKIPFVKEQTTVTQPPPPIPTKKIIPQTLITNETNLPNNLYFILGVALVLFLLLGILALIFFIIYLININKKMDMLILEKFKSNNNILLDNHEYSKYPKSENTYKKFESETKSHDLETILQDIENLNNPDTKKISFEDIWKLPDNLLFILFKDYNLSILSAALVKVDDALRNKVLQILPADRSQELSMELEKLENLNSLSAHAILAMRAKILEDINNLINSGKLDLK